MSTNFPNLPSIDDSRSSYLWDGDACRHLFSQNEAGLQEVAEKVSKSFLNQAFARICTLDYVSSIKKILNNPEFLLMERHCIYLCVKTLGLNSRKELLKAILEKLPSGDRVLALSFLYSDKKINDKDPHDEMRFLVHRELHKAVRQVGRFFFNKAFKVLCYHKLDHGIKIIVNHNSSFPEIDREELDVCLEILESGHRQDLVALIKSKILDFSAQVQICKKNDAELQKIASKVSKEFLEEMFQKICSLNLVSSIKEIINNNPNFFLMEKVIIFRSMAGLGFNQSRELIEAIISKLSIEDEITALNFLVAMLKTEGRPERLHRLRMDVEIFTPLKGTDKENMLHWAEAKLRRVAELVNEDFLKERFYWMCHHNFDICIDEILKSNPNFMSLGEREIKRCLFPLARDLRKELIDKIVTKLANNEEIKNPIQRLDPARRALHLIVRYLRDLRKEDLEKYDEMLKWAWDLDNMYSAMQSCLRGMRIP